jgi:signal transduction histidine kinase
MRPGSSHQGVKTKKMQDCRQRQLFPAYSPDPAQRARDERHGCLPQTITEVKQQLARKIAPQQQFLRHAAMQTVWRHHPAGVIVCDAAGKIILANAAARQMARMEPEGMQLNAAPTIWGRLLAGEDGFSAMGWPPLAALLEQPMAERECRLVQSRRAAYDVMFSTAPLVAAGQRAGAVLMFTDITPIKRRASQLRERAVDEERKRMAGDLHDTLCQGLNAIVLMLQAAGTSAVQDVETVKRQVQRAHEVVIDTLREARQSMWTFSRETTRIIDPAASLALAAEQIFNDTSVQCDLLLQEQPFNLPSRIRFELLRIGKEALTNVLKHSQATRVRMELAYGKQTVQLSVMDDGRGFVPGPAGHLEHGYGLTSMRQRAEGLGGKFIVESQPRRGTRVAAFIPLMGVAKSTAMAA